MDWHKIEKENPGLNIRSASFLGEGWNCRAYLINDDLVFRFPKHADHWQELNREIAFLAFVADRLPLAVPRYVTVVSKPAAAEQGYAVYRYLAGRPIDPSDLRDENARSLAAESIAGLFHTLHALKPDSHVRSLLPCEDARTVARELLWRAERNVAPKLKPNAQRVMFMQFEGYLSASQNFAFKPSVLHADLSSEHVLVKDETISGVLDFGDVNLGDPDYDFMYPFLDFGEAFAIDIAKRYGHKDLERLLGKMRYFAIVDQIGTIVDGPGRAPDGEVTIAWRRLDRLLREK